LSNKKRIEERSNNYLFYEIYFFFIVFFALFGPKFGYIDTSVIAGFLGLPVILLYKKTPIPKQWFSLWVIIAITFCYSIIINYTSNFLCNYLVLRQARVLVAATLLPIVIYLFPLRPKDKLIIVISVLFLNSVTILTQILFPQLQLYMAPIYQFNKSIRHIRAFGLTAGYDSAGYLSVMGFILASLSIIFCKKKIKYFFISLIFAFSVFFTSRTSMALAIVFISFFSFFFIFFKRKKLRFMGILFIFISVFFIIYFFGIVYDTFDISLTKSFIFMPKTNMEYTSSFARTNLNEWRSHTIVFPDNEYLLLFGAGINPPSDMGYVKIIYMIGLFGLFLVIIGHLYILISAHNIFKREIKLVKLSKPPYIYLFENGFNITYWSLMIFVPLQLIINLKNLYFYTRGYYELLIILFFILYSFTRQVKE